jgi:hypothetical protein
MAVFGLLNPRLRASFSDDLAGAVAIIGVQFNNWRSEDSSAQPDPSNAAISEIVASIWSKTKLPIYVQSEHAVLLKKKQVPVKHEKLTNSRMHVKTHEFLYWVSERVPRYFWELRGPRIIVVCHPDHSWRVACLARHYEFEPVFPTACKKVPYAKAKLAHDQWWCRYRPRYILWEYISRAVTFLLWFIGRV